MVDLKAAFEDVKGMDDHRLNMELANPSGLVPGYIVMSELQDRQSMRGSTKGAAKRPSMKDELLQSLPRPEPMVPKTSWTFGASGAGQMPTVVENPEPRMVPAQQRSPSPEPMQIDPSRQYSRGGIIAQLNPMNAMAQALQNPDIKGGLMQEAMNQQNGGLTSLQAPSAPGAPEAPAHNSTMVPGQSMAPQPLVRTFSHGGLASIYRG